MRKLKNEELDRKTIDEVKESQKNPVIVILDNVRSLNNIGSIFRTCDAFLIDKIYLCGITGTPPHRDIHRTALGSELSVAWSYFETTQLACEELIGLGYEIILVEQISNSVSLEDFQPAAQKKYGLVFGNEVEGVDEKLIPMARLSLEIPQFGTKHSLNIAVSVGVVLWDYVSKTLGPKMPR